MPLFTPHPQAAPVPTSPSVGKVKDLQMVLSQGRTWSVLHYAYELPTVKSDRDWVKRHFAAVGFSSSRLVLDAQGNENRGHSRRVSFRVITNAELQIRKILEEPS